MARCRVLYPFVEPYLRRLNVVYEAGAAGSGGARLFSHSFINSDACFFKLLGDKLLRTGGSSSSSLAVFPLAGDRDLKRDVAPFLALKMQQSVKRLILNLFVLNQV